MLVCRIQVGRNEAWAGFTSLPKHAWLGITALVTLSSWQALAIGGSGYIQILADDNVVVRNESEMYKIQSIEWRDIRVLSGLLITVGYWESSCPKSCLFIQKTYCTMPSCCRQWTPSFFFFFLTAPRPNLFRHVVKIYVVVSHIGRASICYWCLTILAMIYPFHQTHNYA